MLDNDVNTEIISKEGHNKELIPYLLFKYAIKTEITRKYYERRLKKFFDFIEFESSNTIKLNPYHRISSKSR